MSSVDSSKDSINEHVRARKGKGGGGGGGGSGSGSAAGSAGDRESAPPAGGGGNAKRKGARAGGARIQFDDQSKIARVKKQQIVRREIKQSSVMFLQHLPEYERGFSVSQGTGFGRSEVHPAVQRLGLKYAEGVITGGHARCAALVDAIHQVVNDFSLVGDDSSGDIRRELDRALKRCIQYVVECRPLSVSMGNFVRYLKERIAVLPENVNEAQGKSLILEAIDVFREKKLEMPVRRIAELGSDLIRDGDKIVLYSSSGVVEALLKHASDAGRSFTVAVIDSRPRYEGRKVAKFLSDQGIAVEYGLINGASFLMTGATKVLLGAHSVMSNGTVLNRVGTGAVALLAKSQNIPILVACETVKFSERVQLDSISFNELDDPNELLLSRDERPRGDPRRVLDESWRSLPNLKLMNINYDLTPTEHVEALITEAGVIPPSSVPVVIQDDELRLQENL